MTLAITSLTLVHVALSLAGLVSGFVVMTGLLHNRRLNRWTGVFLATTIATSATGFLFPVERLLPSHVIGLISLVVLTLAVVARYQRAPARRWRQAYSVSAVAAQYLNFFVLTVQSFLKVPALHALAPTQAEPPFVIVQVAALAVFVVWGIVATIKYRGGSEPRPDQRTSAQDSGVFHAV